MRNKYTGLLLGGMLMMTAPLLAQQRAGDRELEFQGSLVVSTKGGTSNDSGSAAIDLGWFFTDHQEAGLNVLGTLTGSGDFAGLVGPFYRYNFGSGKMVPFAGASINASFGKFAGQSSGGGFGSLEAGVRWFLSRDSAFSLSGSYTYDFRAKQFADQVQILFGFSHFWRK